MNSLSFAFIAFLPFESWDDCQEFVTFHDLYAFHDQCVGVDTSGNRTNYEQEQKLAPDWSLRPKARPLELEK
tara:strand:- start:168 stop:383 length:216 start_codon:yes stop_codon:yes gene_type:complete